MDPAPWTLHLHHGPWWMRPSAPAWLVALPYPLERFWHRLQLHAAIDVSGRLGEDVLVGVAFRLERSGHPIVRDNPVAHAFGRRVRAVVVAADVEPDSERLPLG